MSPRLSIIPAGAVTDPALKARDLQVLCLLGRHTDDHGWCHRSQVKMAKELGVARSTVQGSLDRLEKAGWVQRRRVVRNSGADAAHQYRVLLDTPADGVAQARAVAENRINEAGKEAVQGADIAGLAGGGDHENEGADLSAGGADIAAGGAAPEPAGGADSGPAPMLTTPVKRSERDAGAPAAHACAVDDGDDGDAADPSNTQSVPHARFWKRWPDPVTSSERASQAEWDKLFDDDRQKAIDGIGPFHDFVARQPGSKRKFAAKTYLAEAKWRLLDTEAAKPAPVRHAAKVYSKLWWARIFDLARRDGSGGEGRALSFRFKMAKQGAGDNVTVGDDDDLLAAAERFETVFAHRAAGQGWLRWIEARCRALHIPAPPSNLRPDNVMSDDEHPFRILVPNRDLAGEWGLSGVWEEVDSASRGAPDAERPAAPPGRPSDGGQSALPASGEAGEPGHHTGTGHSVSGADKRDCASGEARTPGGADPQDRARREGPTETDLDEVTL